MSLSKTCYSICLELVQHRETGKRPDMLTRTTLVNVYVDLLVFTRIAGTS